MMQGFLPQIDIMFIWGFSVRFHNILHLSVMTFLPETNTRNPFFSTFLYDKICITQIHEKDFCVRFVTVS